MGVAYRQICTIGSSLTFHHGAMDVGYDVVSVRYNIVSVGHGILSVGHGILSLRNDVEGV